MSDETRHDERSETTTPDVSSQVTSCPASEEVAALSCPISPADGDELATLLGDGDTPKKLATNEPGAVRV